MSDIKNTQTSGFYYDIQMSNPLLTATLHTNTYIYGIKTDERGTIRELNSGDNPYEFPGKFEWKLWSPNKETNSSKDDVKSGSVYCLDPITHNYSYAYDENPSACYRAKPLITSILSEDFQISTSNSWGDAGGASKIESIFNELKSTAPHTKETGGLLGNLSDAIGEFIKNKESFAGKANGFLKKISDGMKNNHTDMLNSALITQGTRFSYYGGTSTTFGNLSMRFTLFADWVYEGGNWVFKTVHDQLREIYPYVVGKYYPLNFNLKEKAAGTRLENTADAVDKTISSFFGWQQPPAGFQSDIRSLDTCQKGTLRLVLGGYYTAENLIINDMNVNFSKIMAKVPPKVKHYDIEGSPREWYNTDAERKDEEGNVTKVKTFSGKGEDQNRIEVKTKDGDLTPLYADITITLRPASSYSDNSIINFSSNQGKGRFSYFSAKMRNDKLQREIQEKQQEEKTQESGNMGKNQPATTYDNGEYIALGKNGDIFN